MATLIINNIAYKVPADVEEQNRTAEDCYGQLFLKEVVSGLDELDSLIEENINPRMSSCVEAYAGYKNIKIEDVDLKEVERTLFAWYADYDEEEYSIFILEKQI